MENIPLIKLKKEQTLDETISKTKKLLKKLKENETVYILDIDGIEKDKPNYCVYQRLVGSYDLWIDNGPRNIGDIVDTFMAGATKVTIRREFCPQITIHDIREITENELYTIIQLEVEENFSDYEFYENINGLVNFNSKEQIDKGLEYFEHIKRLSQKVNTYSYENNLQNKIYWEKLGIKGLLIDIDKKQEEV